jgi:hypothetical protein
VESRGAVVGGGLELRVVASVERGRGAADRSGGWSGGRGLGVEVDGKSQRGCRGPERVQAGQVRLHAGQRGIRGTLRALHWRAVHTVVPRRGVVDVMGSPGESRGRGRLCGAVEAAGSEGLLWTLRALGEAVDAGRVRREMPSGGQARGAVRRAARRADAGRAVATSAAGLPDRVGTPLDVGEWQVPDRADCRSSLVTERVGCPPFTVVLTLTAAPLDRRFSAVRRPVTDASMPSIARVRLEGRRARGGLGTQGAGSLSRRRHEHHRE